MPKREITAERRNEISRLIITNGSIRVGDIAKKFGVSTETVRKDLIYLDKLGIIKKSHGGAMASSGIFEKPFSKRANENIDSKREIALLAQQFIPKKGIVILDSGSTVLELAKLITLKSGLTVITNSIGVADALADTDNKVYLVGGEVRGVTMSLSGHWASQAFRSVNADVAFLGSSGIKGKNGPCAESFVEAEVKCNIIENSKKNIVLADSSKFENEALVEYASWEKIDVLVTDSNISKKLLPSIEKQVEVIKK